MSTKAVIALAGKQYLAEKGKNITIDKHVDHQVGESFATDQVLLLVADDDSVTVGTPLVKGAKVSLKVLELKKGKKVTISRFRAKSRYRKTKGHRQPESVLEVTAISTPKAK